MNILRSLAITVAVIVACVAGLIVYIEMWDAEETELWSGFEAMSQPSSDKRPFEHYEFMCVVYNTGELLRESERIGRNVYFGCSIYDSNYPVIVTVKNGQISCKQTTKFSFRPAKGNPACIRSGDLVVRKKKDAGDGHSYFEIGRKSQ